MEYYFIYKLSLARITKRIKIFENKLIIYLINLILLLIMIIFKLMIYLNLLMLESNGLNVILLKKFGIKVHVVLVGLLVLLHLCLIDYV